MRAPIGAEVLDKLEANEIITPDDVETQFLLSFMKPVIQKAEDLSEKTDLRIDVDKREYPDNRLFFTFPFDIQKKDFKKKDGAVVCFGVDSTSLNKPDGTINLEVVCENGEETRYLKLESVTPQEIETLLEKFSEIMRQYNSVQEGQTINLRHTNAYLVEIIEEIFPNKPMTPKTQDVPEYSLYNVNNPEDESNLKDLDWLQNSFGKQIDKNVDQGAETLSKISLGNQEFVFLQSGEMSFLMNNKPTIEFLEAAVHEGIINKEELEKFVTMEEEIEKIQKTKDQYETDGSEKGEGKNYRENNFWRDAPANYEYDPVRGLYYLEIGGEPVMDEFEKGYIQLLGANAAKYGGAVVEVGFGMGISAQAIQQELLKHQEKGEDVVHIVIEYNHEVAEKAREWGKRQNVPVIVLEGDWKDEIKKIPDGILTGALADPYPLDSSEKHEDAARTATEVHKKLRPGGVMTYYSDSQYCLSEGHSQIAQDAGFKWLGTITSSFGKSKNTGEYYDESLKMAIPCLYKEGGTGDSEIHDGNDNPEEIKKLIRKIFVDDPARFLKQHL